MTILAQILAAVQQKRTRRAAVQQLRRMSLHQLADIGIAPDQIEDAVDGMLGRAGDAGDPDRGIPARSAPRGVTGPLPAASPR